MMTNKSTTIRIRFVDLKNNPFPNLYHEIRVSGDKYAISAGYSDPKGLGVHISRPVGTQLDILVKHPITKKMVNANQKVTVTVPVNKGIFRVQAPFYIETTKLKPNNKNGGNYRRKTHKVKPGETLISIAKKFDTTWQVLYQLNRDVVRDKDTIHVGDILKIPPENSGLRGQSNNNVNSTSTTEYTLKKGDTLWDISQDTGIPVSELKRINNISDPTTLQTGQTIKLRDNSSAKPQSTPTPSKHPTSRQQPPASKPQEDEGILDRILDYGADKLEDIKEELENFSDALRGGKNDKPAGRPSSPIKPKKPEKNTDAPPPIETKNTDTNSKDGTPKTVTEKEKPPIIFPLLKEPINQSNQLLSHYDWRRKVNELGASQAVFDRNRGRGRKHAGRDLYTNINPIDKAEKGAEVVSIAPGIILRKSLFYNDTSQVSIKHTTSDGRQFIVRYGELDNDSIPNFSDKQKVEQGTVLGNTGVLRKSSGTPMALVEGKNVSMLHFEYFSGEGEDLDRADNLTQRGNNKYSRRSDIKDPLDILMEGYNASFIKPVSSLPESNRLPIEKLKLSQKGEEFIKSFESIKISSDGSLSYYYNDDVGYCTVGWGHLVKGKVSCASINIKANKDAIPIDEAQRLFDEDKVKKGEFLVKSAIKVPLFQHEFDALVSLAFNVGNLADIAPNLCKKINNHQYFEGSKEMLDITKAGGKELRGLVIRRHKEFNIFNENKYELHQ